MEKRKKTSSVSAKQAMDALTAIGYQTIAPDKDREVRPTERKAVRENPDRMISKSGQSVHLIFAGPPQSGRAPSLFVPIKGMLSHGQAESLENLAKIKFSDFKH